MKCMSFIVSGRVQGVFFRQSTLEKATQLNLCGWAMNRSDGTVQVFACGDDHALQTLAAWLQMGPPAAQVTQVEISDEPIDEQIPDNFYIRY